MGVPKSARQVSGMDYIDICRRICEELFRWCNHLPKRYAFRLLNPLCEHATEALYHVKAANKVYVLDRATYEKRRGHLLAAECELAHVETMLDILFDVRKGDYAEAVQGLATDDERRRVRRPGYGKFAILADLIEEERKRIAGVKARDTHEFNKLEK